MRGPKSLESLTVIWYDESMTNKTKAPKLTWREAMTQAKLDGYNKQVEKQRRRGRAAIVKVYFLDDVRLLEARGWTVHTFQPSAITNKYWYMTPPALAA